MKNVLTITLLILGLIIAVLQLYITATGTHWGEMLSIGGEPDKIDCASLETGQEQCCIDNDYGYWDEFKKQCISDVNESSDTEGGGGGK